jgi:predicted nucleotidyltransferase
MEFGSAVFGGDDETSDIDLLLLSYNDIMTRERFITDFAAYLQKIAGVENL